MFIHDYNETVVDANGTILWSIDNVADPVSVDENGFVYTVPARSPDNGYIQPSASAMGHITMQSMVSIIGILMDVMLDDYRVPSAIVDAYYPNGTLYWRGLSGEPYLPPVHRGRRLPLYNNGTIYVPLENGIVAYRHARHGRNG